jgi:hypothetical protein
VDEDDFGAGPGYGDVESGGLKQEARDLGDEGEVGCGEREKDDLSLLTLEALDGINGDFLPRAREA